MQQPPPGLTRLGRLDVILLRHAEAVTGAGWKDRDDERPLSDAGSRAARELAEELDPYGLTAIYSSPMPRAQQTVEPLAQRRGMEVTLLPDLRERDTSAVARTEWMAHLERSWTNPDYEPPGSETGRAAQRRALRVLDLLRAHYPDGGRVLVASHGNLIALMLQALEPAVDFAFHMAMPLPALYHLEHDGIGWRVMGGQGFVEAAAVN
jgi:2,3-bisphosphoglycerate-dependent phosphoglycerate mutase